jgi:hypothetical protein
LAKVQVTAADRVIVLGDVIGKGPEP